MTPVNPTVKRRPGQRPACGPWPRLAIQLADTMISTGHMHRCTCASLALAPLALAPAVVHASFLPPAMMDAAAMGIAWFVVVVVPIGAIVLFWMVHVLPEKIAEKRHHPQRDAIHTLCLLSLVFGGLLWPFAWLWAFTKPVLYRHAYGTEKHEDYYHEAGEKAGAGALLEQELVHLREELDAMAARGTLSPRLRVLREDLAQAVAAPPAAPVAAPAATPAQPAAPGDPGAKAGGA